MTEMGHVLKENFSITYLNLRNNACGTHLKGSLGNQLAGFSEFFKSLSSNLTLRRLNLAQNRIVDEQATSVAHLLEDSEGLVELNLSMNNITDAGAVPIARSLSTNLTLKGLNLRHNALTSTTGFVFESVLKDQNATLRVLDVSSTTISLQQRNDLYALIKANDNAEATTAKVAQQLRDKFMHQCRKLFFETDYDQSGTISQDEQWLQYSKVGFDIHSKQTQKYVEESWKKMDMEGTGDVDVDEFMHMAERMYDEIMAPDAGREAAAHQ